MFYHRFKEKQIPSAMVIIEILHQSFMTLKLRNAIKMTQSFQIIWNFRKF